MRKRKKVNKSTSRYILRTFEKWRLSSWNHTRLQIKTDHEFIDLLEDFPIAFKIPQSEKTEEPEEEEQEANSGSNKVKHV